MHSNRLYVQKEKVKEMEPSWYSVFLLVLYRHCMSGYRGFQQPMYQPPPYNHYGAPRGRCYSCGSQRQKRSIGAVMEQIRAEDENPPPVNVSVPIILHVNLHDLAHREHLIELIPALRQLNEHTRYRITHGNEDNLFRIHKRQMDAGVVHFIHLNQPSNRVAPGKYKLGIEVRPMIDLDTAVRQSLNSKKIEDAMIRPTHLELEFNVENWQYCIKTLTWSRSFSIYLEFFYPKLSWNPVFQTLFYFLPNLILQL